MPTLSNILDSEQNRKFILAQASYYGFDKVRFFVDDSRIGMLYFVVSEKDEANYKSALRAVLSDKFKCTIDILIDTELNELLASTILSNSISLLNYDKQTIESKLEKKLDQIMVDPLEDKCDLFMIQRGIALAQRIKRKKDALSSDENLKEKELDLEERKKAFLEDIKNPKNFNILTEVLTSLPNEIFLTLDEQYNKRKNSETTHYPNFFK